jgi:Uma2 family endonuclease
MTVAESQQLLSPDAPKPHRFTRDEYYLMANAGMFKNQRVELIEGVIVDMSLQNDPHAVTTLLVQQSLLKALPHLLMRCQLPLTLGEKTEPEPDFAFTEGKTRDFLGTGKHPAFAHLVIEISDTTLEFDRKKKSSLYAQAGIPDYWIMNLRDHCIEVHRDPVAEPTAPFGFRYKSVTTLKPPESISPLANPTASIPIADLLP